MCVTVTDETENNVRRSHAATAEQRSWKRPVMAALLAMISMIAPAALFAQERHGGGEANLILPSLDSVTFLGMGGHTWSSACSASSLV
jgi:hypothetical protein